MLDDVDFRLRSQWGNLRFFPTTTSRGLTPSVQMEPTPKTTVVPAGTTSREATCLYDLAPPAVGIRWEEREAVVGDHAVHVATALMGVRGGEQSTVLGPYPDSPQAELPGRTGDVLLEGDRDPLTDLRPHLLVVSQGLRDPRRDEDVEDHEAAHGVAG